MSTQPECPECEKLVAVHEKSQEFGLFLDWLFSNEGTLCRWEGARYFDPETGDELGKYERGCMMESEGYFPTRRRIEQILANYFNIDMDKVNTEREALLKWMREQGDFVFDGGTTHASQSD